MQYILLFVAIIAILVIRHKFMKKIDEEEAVAMSTPGNATFIRTNYPNLVERLESQCGLSIDFERKDMVRMKKYSNELLVLQQWSGQLLVGYIRDGQSIQEWKFPVGTNIEEILSCVTKYI